MYVTLNSFFDRETMSKTKSGKLLVIVMSFQVLS